MAKATDRAKAGNVTVATVRKRDEASRLVQQLETAGIECALVEERLMVPAGVGRSRSGGIKVQVDRSVAKQAIELLREQHGAAIPTQNESSQPSTRFHLPADGWLRTALEVCAILAAATILAVLFFLY
jgi:hypothetical protein